MKQSNFGVIGLGVMGRSLSLNIAENGHSLSVYNRSENSEINVVPNFLNQNSEFKNIAGFTDLPTFVNSLQTPRKILLMVQAGAAVDSVLEQLIPLLSANDMVIDGGNSHYLDTKKRFESLIKSQIYFFGTGISGGEAGARKGPSIMPGGNRESYEMIAPILESVAAKDKNGQPCCTFIGKDGAGHFVKMVHNGIEYAEMQLLAECYALLKSQFSYTEISNIFSEWNKGELSSYLLEITANIFNKKEKENYLLDLILDKAGNKGTGSWSSKAALDLGFPVTMMSDAVFARYISSFKIERIELAKKITFSTLTIDEITEKRQLKQPLLNHLKNAYQFARIINHHQGFALIQQASETYDWQLNLSEIARIWTNGCIIRSTLMESLTDYFKKNNSLIHHDKIIEILNDTERDLRGILTNSIENRVPTPTLSSAFQYWISMTSEQLSANLIQAQRDYFGSHTYQRIDKNWAENFHTEW
jgi:6-phosphogluconate dehydrogenase